MPKRLEPPLLGVDPKILGDRAIDAVADVSRGVLAPRLDALEPLDEAAVEEVSCVDDDVPRLAKGLPASCGGLPNKTDPLPAPALAVGGGPAGVVESPNKVVVGLFVGVVVFA